jgi:threonine dehydratase
VSIEHTDIVAAADRLRGIIRDLPPLRARWLEDLVGGPVYLITENLQRAGSFKVRGAYNRMAQLTADELQRGVVAASAGNHAQGVAYAAAQLGAHATVFMPHQATIPKVTATRAYGADVRFAGDNLGESLEAAQAFSAETGAIFIHPFDHPHVVAGQGTVGLEIVEKIPDVRTVVACTGGGGLLAGVALAVKSANPNVTVVGAQAEQAAAYPPSLAAGSPQALDSMATMADGIAVPLPGDVPFALVQEFVDRIDTVSEEDLSRAVLATLERQKLLIEPAGAAGVAAVMADPTSFAPPVAIVLSGGNVDPLVLLRILRHGLSAAGRYLTVMVRLPDTPGSLARFLNDVQAAGANVLEVSHDRTSHELGVDEVDIVVQLETRGLDHCQRLMSKLQTEGYAVRTASPLS